MATSSAELRRIATRYAQALFSLATEKKQLDAVKRDMEVIDLALEADPAFGRLLSSPVISRVDQEAGVRAVLTRLKASALTQDFFRVLSENRRLEITPFVIQRFAELLAESRNETTARVTSAYPLSAKQLDTLRAAIRKATGRSEVRTITHEDPQILGGVVIRVDGRMFDNSIVSKIERLSASMKAQVHTQ